MIIKPVIKEQYLVFLLISILLIVAGYILSAHNLSFSFENSYVRRIEGRENISKIGRYIIPACLNSIAPLLAFLAGVNRKYHYFIIALLFAILGFGVIGAKAPIGYVFLLFVLGYFTKENKNKISLILLSFIALVVLFALIEYWLFNFSWIADVVIRRAFLVVPQIQMYYIDYFLEYFDFDTLLFGLPKDSTTISFLVGNYYFSNPLTNSNTNTFLYEIGRNGLLGYGLSIIFLSLFFSCLDFWYERYQQNAIIGVSVIYSFLLIEQSYTTAMITSGVLYIFVLTLIASKRLKDSKQNDSCD